MLQIFLLHSSFSIKWWWNIFIIVLKYKKCESYRNANSWETVSVAICILLVFYCSHWITRPINYNSYADRKNCKLLFATKTNCKHISLIGNTIVFTKQNMLTGSTHIRRVIYKYIYIYNTIYINLVINLVMLFYIIHRFNDLISSALINPKGNLLLLGNLKDEKEYYHVFVGIKKDISRGFYLKI